MWLGPLGASCSALGAGIVARAYTPRTNGKAQRFIQTLMQEWAYAFPYATSQPGRHAVRTGL
jgi:hypothetical protein